LLLVATCLALAGCAGPRWSFSRDAAFKQAAEHDQLVLVYYRTAVCPYSAKMDRRVFTDPQVRERLADFCLLQRDYAIWRKEAENLGITGTPGFVIYRPNGSVVGTPAVGEMSAAEFRAFLAAAKLQR
jgi:thioredoxin-related protein